MKREGKDGIIHIFLLLFAVIQIYPLFWLLSFSLKGNNEIFGGNVAGLPQHWKIENYQKAIGEAKVLNYFFNSVLVTAVTIVIIIILASTAAYAIERMIWRGRQTVMKIILLGLMVPIHAALLPLFMVLKHIHLLNTYFALIIPYVAFGLPMAVYIVASFLSSLPRELEEAAAIDGCGTIRIFGTVIFPLVKPALATVSIFTYISSWNELMFAVTFVSKQQYKTLTVGIMSMVGTYTTKWGQIGAGLVIATIPTIVIYLLLSEQVQKSLVDGAVKG